MFLWLFTSLWLGRSVVAPSSPHLQSCLETNQARSTASTLVLQLVLTKFEEKVVVCPAELGDGRHCAAGEGGEGIAMGEIEVATHAAGRWV